MRLVRVRLVNVQSHVDTVFEPAAGVTFIVGPTNAGKSAFRRAVRWCLFGGTDWARLRRKGQKEIQVELVFDTGHRLLRYRSNSENRYHLFMPDGTEHKFENVDRDIPPLVLHELGFFAPKLDGKNPVIINVADQHEGPFLLTDTPGIAQIKLGTLTNAEELEQAGSVCSTEKIRLARTIKECEERVERFAQSIKDLEWLPPAIALMPEVEAALQEMNQIRTSHDGIVTMEARANGIQGRENTLALQEQVLSGLDITGATTALQEIHSIGPLIQKMDQAVTSSIRIMNGLANLDVQMNGLVARRKELTARLDSIPACPTCGRPFDHASIERLVALVPSTPPIAGDPWSGM